MRVACARLRDAPLAAHLRCEPGLATQPLAIVNSSGARGRVVACTREARALGITIGQLAHQARARASELVVRVMDDGVLHAAYAALADAAEGIAARVEPDGPQVYADLTDMGALYPSDGGLVAALDHAIRDVGLRANIGVADGKAIARVAATGSVGGAIVPSGDERLFMAPMPIDVLPVSHGLRADFARLGLRSVGEVAAMPLESTGLRLGPEAAMAITLACGTDDTPFYPRPHATRFEESLTLDWEVQDAGSLVFVVKRLADALVLRLACRSLAAAAIHLSFALVSRAIDERTLPLAAPTRDVTTIVHLVRAALDGRPPPDAVTGVRLVAVAAALRPVQLGLFDPPGVAPEAWTLTLARLTALVGEGQVGTPFAPDTHRPHAVSIVPFLPSSAVRNDGRAPRKASLESLALHVFRPPKPADVLVTTGQMTALQAGEINGRVRSCCGPFRVVGEWWGDRFERDGYDVVIENGGRYLVAFDRVARAWRVEGRYE